MKDTFKNNINRHAEFTRHAELVSASHTKKWLQNPQGFAMARAWLNLEGFIKGRNDTTFVFRNVLKKLTISIILFIFSCNLFAQYYQQFSQYLLNGQAINPAYAGSREVLSTTLLYRNQWVGFEGAPKTMTFSANTPLSKLSSAVGIQIFSDKIGVSKHNGIFLNYAYRIRFKKNHRTLAFGMGGGINTFSSNFSNVTTNDLGDKAFEEQYLKKTRPNFSFGAYYYSNRFFAGVSIPSLLHYGYDVFGVAPDSMQTLPYNIYYTAGYTFGLNKDVKFSPSILLKTNYPQKGQIDLNLKLSIYDVLGMAASLRFGDALVWIIDFQIIPNQLKIGYAHDFSTSVLNKYAHGTNEFMLRYEFAYKSNVVSTKLF